MFKNHVVYTRFVTTEQSASQFYAFTTTFCAIADRPALAPVKIPSISSVPESLVPAKTEDRSESAATGELNSALTKEEDFVKEQEEEELQGVNKSRSCLKT